MSFEKRPSAVTSRPPTDKKVLIKKHANSGCGGLTPHLHDSLGRSTPDGDVDSEHYAAPASMYELIVVAKLSMLVPYRTISDVLNNTPLIPNVFLMSVPDITEPFPLKNFPLAP
jgi:hypothetical protein